MIVTALSIASLALPPGPPEGEVLPLSPRERAVHLLSRCAFGPRPGDVDRLIEIGAEKWLEEQFDPELRDGPILRERLGLLDAIELNPTEMYAYTYYELPPDNTRKDRALQGKKRGIPKWQLFSSIPLRQAQSTRQLQEVMSEFWRNHFNVSYTKGWPAGLYIPDYEARVIRDNALGSFPAMLDASAHHPAMMHYLDNMLSKRPMSAGELSTYEQQVRARTGSKELAEEAAMIAAKRGVNENYARELLELHTMGVDKGYTQSDVIAAAEVLTGWGLADGRPRKDGYYGFKFDQSRHIDGNRTFLKTILREDKNKSTGQGDRLLKLLAAHKQTSLFISEKLVRYLVNDNPPPRLVKSVASVYRKTKGDIPAMLRKILESDEFWARENYQAKFKTPNEFLMSALRVTDAVVEDTMILTEALNAMGQPTYMCDDPTGYFDTAKDWLDPGVLTVRWDVALRLAAGELEGVRIPAEFFGEIEPGGSVLGWMQDLIQRVLPGGASVRTLAMVNEVVRAYKEKNDEIDVRELGPQILGLLLGSPEFQRQ